MEWNYRSQVRGSLKATLLEEFTIRYKMDGKA